MIPSILAARFTVLPMTLYLIRASEPMFPAMTSPVLTPMPIISLLKPLPSISVLTASIEFCISTAQAIALAVSSGLVIGAPNTAMMASPMKLSTLPPYFMTTFAIVPR